MSSFRIEGGIEFAVGGVVGDFSFRARGGSRGTDFFAGTQHYIVERYIPNFGDSASGVEEPWRNREIENRLVSRSRVRQGSRRHRGHDHLEFLVAGLALVALGDEEPELVAF